MAEVIVATDVVSAIQHACIVVAENRDYLTSLDQAVGDGDMGITTGKIADALIEYTNDTPVDDIGAYLSRAGMTANRAGPSTMGTLLATALMRAGKAVKGKTELTPEDVGAMFTAAAVGMQERGKASLGDKTILDVIFPASEALNQAIGDGDSLHEAGEQSLAAAEAGRDSVTPLRSKVGRAGWVGERTEGELDPGCVLFTMMLKAVVEE